MARIPQSNGNITLGIFEIEAHDLRLHDFMHCNAATWLDVWLIA